MGQILEEGYSGKEREMILQVGYLPLLTFSQQGSADILIPLLAETLGMICQEQLLHT